jgi:hypothetical protein
MPGFSSSSAVGCFAYKLVSNNKPTLYPSNIKKGLVDSYPYKAEGYKILQVLCPVQTSQNMNCIPAVVIMGGTVW